ncbi:hypothetical protein HQ45_09105 [Porphyromonas crevioricanis]|uniref:Uncharacterized protein n=2 Tax=Porphyromonas crevioricanis TaxID=393921 RepID=A0A0A2FKL6_9PORP|nr:hypothetical protein HQ45_09105 [Porphyromonas crevioricanis]GAD05568.1 hypothetical protein PORCRE_1273 [Porphyromonas crevioricanis JCM 15906]SJZ71830.1 hypothetical protein SAMN02745203_00648 [Porphyromonas crevioricanis]SQH73545.1 Uncharacterised protein [Porphyromonas crevioricanis]
MSKADLLNAIHNLRYILRSLARDIQSRRVAQPILYQLTSITKDLSIAKGNPKAIERPLKSLVAFDVLIRCFPEKMPSDRQKDTE